VSMDWIIDASQEIGTILVTLDLQVSCCFG